MCRNYFYRFLCLCILGASTLWSAPDTVCHIVINENVLKLDGLVRNVPPSMVAVAPEIRYEAPDITAINAQTATPAIVLLIDDSGSMMQNDKDANRYTVTKEILDEIYGTQPETRVAVITFRNWLAWDHRENDMFRKISSPFEWNDSYFPLTPLDSVFADGKRGIEKIKGLFELDQWNLLQAFHSDSTERTRPQQYDADGNPRPPKQSDQGTDITLAFTAAKDALKNCSTPKQRQFIVFLSDGYHGGVDVEMESAKKDYIDGEGIPATYTIFLGDSVKVPPEQLLTMIDNIKTNGYSEANERSELWSIASSHDTLLALMQREILSQVYKPLKMASRAETDDDVAMNISENSVLFTKPIPLNANATVVELKFTFPLESENNDGSSDTVISTRITFVRDEATSSLDGSFSSECYPRDISLESGGLPVLSTLRNSQTALSARFTLEGIEAASSPVASVYAASGNDSMLIDLNGDNGTFSGDFKREQSDDPDVNDNTLQNEENGALRIVWRNRYIPLDTVSETYRISPYDPVIIESVRYLDTNRDGAIDALAVTTDRAINELEFDNLDAERLLLPSERALTLQSVKPAEDGRGFTINVTQGSGAPETTGLLDNDTLTITEYDLGPFNDYIQQGRYAIEDGIAPVISSATVTISNDGDTLIVAFTEPVGAIPNGYPFKLHNSDGEMYTVRVQTVDISDDGTVVTFSVLENNAPDGTPAVGDSIWVAESAELTDRHGNTQHEPNRKVHLGINVPEKGFIIGALRNPVDRKAYETIEAPGWKTFTTGTVIAIEPNFPLRDITKSINKIEVRIYDAVGHLLTYNPPNKAVDNRWYIHWNGTNKSKRNVGRGVYLAVVTMKMTEDFDKDKIIEKVKIAFQ